MAQEQNEPPFRASSNFGKWSVAAVALVALIAILPVLLTLKQVKDGAKLKNVTAYSEPEYPPEKSVLCPGDTMVFTPTLHVVLAPVIVEVSSTWWKDDEPQRTIITGKKADTSISIFRENRDVSRAISIQVPDLPPGHYSYLRATESSTGSEPGITSVRITVPDGCPAASTGP